MSGGRQRAVLGVQGMQSLQHGERGIARYVLEHARALVRRAPERIAGLDLDPELPPPEALSRIGPLRAPAARPGDPADLYHVMSPFEMRPLERLYPLGARRPATRLVVTAYDLIPLLMPDRYLANPRVASWYRTRLGLLRQADAVVAISAATAGDVVRRLGIPARRVFNVTTGCSDLFGRGDPAAALRAVHGSGLDQIGERFILYTGGDDYRKNLPRLVEAYAGMRPEVREQHQLVITCKLGEGSRAALRALAEERGVGRRVVLTGFVSDATLVALYQSCGLFVFPSLYEGFGLPVLEAIACGAVAIASDTSSLRELVTEPAGRFDPESAESIAAAMERALTDSVLRQRLMVRHPATLRTFTWESVAERTLEAYDSLAPRRRRPPSRPRLAMFTPMPPIRTGIADYSFRLLEDLVRYCDVDVFVDGPPGQFTAPPVSGLELLGAPTFPWVRAVRDYARVLYVMGNNSYHHYVRRALRECPGDVHAHDVRLVNLYQELKHSAPDEPVALEVAGDPYLFSEVARYAHRVLVHSEFARQVALGQGARDTVVLPFGHPPLAPERAGGGPPVIATFGLVTLWKEAELLVRAFALLRARIPGARLVFAGRIGPPDEGPLRAEIARLGLGESVILTGALSEPDYQRWLEAATVAVQLRKFANGELSGAVADCLSAGVPTAVTAIGGFAELPVDAVVPVRPAATEEEVSELLHQLLLDRDRLRELGRRAREHAARNSFSAVAAALWRSLAYRGAAGGAALPVDPAGAVAAPEARAMASSSSA